MVTMVEQLELFGPETPLVASGGTSHTPIRTRRTPWWPPGAAAGHAPGPVPCSPSSCLLPRGLPALVGRLHPPEAAPEAPTMILQPKGPYQLNTDGGPRPARGRVAFVVPVALSSRPGPWRVYL